MDGCECDYGNDGGCQYNHFDRMKLAKIAQDRFPKKQKECVDNPLLLHRLNEAMAVINKAFPQKGKVL